MSCGFQEGIFGCFDDIRSCLCVACLPFGAICIQAQAVARVTGEGTCMPYCLDFCCGFIGTALNRSKIRERLGIEGSCILDCLIWIVLGPCAACQEYREVQKRVPVGQGLTVVMVKN